MGGVASVKGVKEFNPEAAKKKFFEIYLDKVIKLYSCISLIYPFNILKIDVIPFAYSSFCSMRSQILA